MLKLLDIKEKYDLRTPFLKSKTGYWKGSFLKQKYKKLGWWDPIYWTKNGCK